MHNISIFLGEIDLSTLSFLPPWFVIIHSEQSPLLLLEEGGVVKYAGRVGSVSSFTICPKLEPIDTILKDDTFLSD